MQMRRVYDAVESDEGRRVLVDRLWPRGIAKTDPRVGRWLRDVAPSTELRHWYEHDPAKFDEFVARYRAELADGPAAEALAELRRLANEGPLTLVTATKDLNLSHLIVLTRLLEGT
ncbi:DUF488 family protein [Mycobacterium sp. ACS4331]|uniref:DUF488 domain-containing protein n=1 Tax=Mycobacterium sp. ACS4331 TaxID=1834121 RepID=UPI0008019421|nr:DUF488 family protein [Mycobacterium sp. ACS4331]OBF21540.1 hypothetical protein A5727_08655 [Mycobacterium sp. ACS4331]